ncbi:hypothetical protein Glove_198g26 [Diversispora epigaea]|uniref:Protein kinase domain-containing protein n=1 Tax=Diversispora epigaea TaxID=1348612 RepID=A0A397ITD4_9GLOM|nr:hypothetical protein Glove_198g26 [Diversispora epigaea]
MGTIKLNDFGINYLKSPTTVIIPIQITDLRYYSLGIILWEISNDGISSFEKELITNLSLPLPTSKNNNFIDLINETILKVKREKYIPGIPSKYKEFMPV